jgi:XTP/dITP diphosphohydrolase
MIAERGQPRIGGTHRLDWLIRTMAPTLVIATNNPGKLREIAALLDGCGFALATPRDLGYAFDVEETGATFEENAKLKAVAAARLTGFTALADDSGLEVDALGGRPGVVSARYAGGDRTADGMDEREQCRIVLAEMAGVAEERRTARFRCAIAIATPAGDVRYADGVFEGRIGHEPRGDNGFGYDPIFIIAGRDATSAELPAGEKNAISHRGQAARKAREILKELSSEHAS